MSMLQIRRQVTPEDIEIIHHETMGFNDASDPLVMCVHIGRIVGLAPTQSTQELLGRMNRKAEYAHSPYEAENILATPVHAIGISLGAQTTAHMMALGLNASPLSTYLAEIMGVRGANAVATPVAKTTLCSELDELMFDGEMESAKELYELASGLRLNRPLEWATLRGAYRVASLFHRIRT